MRILFLNQFFPPDPAPTGILLRELGDFLTAHGHEAIYVDARQEYLDGQKDRGRLWRELRGLLALAWRAFRVRRPDVIFSATSPPCLLIGATLLAKLKGARSAHWLMDMYPELAVALEEIRPGAVSGVLGNLMRVCYRNCDALGALDEDMATRLRRYGARPEIIPPWVPEPLLEPKGGDPALAGTIDPVWVYSGNLGRAHDWRTMIEAQAILEKSGSLARLRFQGKGGSQAPAKALAAELNLQRCEWADYAPENELRATLRRAGALVVTQKPAAQGLLWPSKLALLLDLGRPILWIGKTEGAVAERLRAVPGAGIFAPGDAAGVADWVRKALENKEPISRGYDARVSRAAALEQWKMWLAFMN